MNPLRDKFRFTCDRHSGKPFLSVITRMMTGKRPLAQLYHRRAMAAIEDKDFEQHFIHDDIGLGLHAANTSFQFVKDSVAGKYVFLLDDDDTVRDRLFITKLKAVAREHAPDVIMFKNIIDLGERWPGNIYPTANVWNARPIATQIGGSCFVVTKEIFRKYIHEFALPQLGDFAFIDAIFTREKKLKVHWLDEIFVETTYKGRGRPETR